MKKNSFVLTITDRYGSKQYSIHKMIKKILLFLALIFILIGVFTLLYIQFMHTKLDTLKTDTQELKTQMLVLKKERTVFQSKNKQLNESNTQLSQLMQENHDKLSSMNTQLSEVEEMIGLGPDINASFTQRVTQARDYQKQHIKNTLSDEKKRINKDAKAKTISAIQETISNLEKRLILNAIPNGKPLRYKRVSSNFGYRTHPVTKRKSFHAGLDLPAKHGTTIYAPASGVVSVAQKKGHYGNFLLLTHAYGFKTAYGHLSRFAVKSGDYVNKGDIIAYVGSTGRSTGPHLHYEVRYLTKWLDPKQFMFWDTKVVNSITKKVSKVNWKSIFKQTKNMIQLSRKK